MNAIVNVLHLIGCVIVAFVEVAILGRGFPEMTDEQAREFFRDNTNP